MSQFTRQRTVSQRDAADAFVRGTGAAVRCSSALTTTAEVAYSYAEPIAVFDVDRPGTLLLTGEHFSVTTSKHVGMIRRAAEQRGVPHEEGASGEELREHAARWAARDVANSRL